MVLIRCKDKSFRNTKVNLPIDGEKNINEKGLLEVSEKCADLLVFNTDLYEFIKKPKKVEVEEEDEEDTDDNGGSEEETEDDNSEETDWDSLSLPELIEALEEAGIDPSSYDKFKTRKNLMVKFVKKTLNQ